MSVAVIWVKHRALLMKASASATNASNAELRDGMKRSILDAAAGSCSRCVWVLVMLDEHIEFLAWSPDAALVLV